MCGVVTGRWAILTDCESDHDDVIHALAALLLQGAYDETLLVCHEPDPEISATGTIRGE